MKINYNDRKFRVITNSVNGELSNEMTFHYKQTENILSCSYSGEKIIKGHLIGVVDEHGLIDIKYHQINSNGELMTGTCKSTPEQLKNGKIRLHEEWKWTSGDKSDGNSVLEEL